MCLRDDLLSLAVGGRDDAGALLLGIGASIQNDLRSLATRVGDDCIRLIANLGSLCLGSVSLLDTILDLVLACIEHRDNLWPNELGKQEPDDEEDNERGNELRHLGDKDIRTARLRTLGECQGGHARHRGGDPECYPHACNVLHDSPSGSEVRRSIWNTRLFNNQCNNKADQGQGLSKGGAHDEDSEDAVLNLRLTCHGERDAMSGQARPAPITPRP